MMDHRQLDRSQAFATLHGDKRRTLFMQNECFYDHEGKRVHRTGATFTDADYSKEAGKQAAVEEEAKPGKTSRK